MSDIIFVTEFKENGESELVEVNYIPIPDNPDLNNFIANDIASVISDGWISANKAFLVSGAEFLNYRTLHNLKFKKLQMKN